MNGETMESNGDAPLSVVIAALDDAGRLKQVLERVFSADGVEVLVADGGSSDGTCQCVRQAGARLLETQGGRAAQFNAGAAAVSGGLLLFLHADTLPPERYPGLVRAALAKPGVVAGAFRFKTDASGVGMRVVEWVTNLRSRCLQYPYGDQGLFMRRSVFEELGGFPQLPIMEDFEFVRRLRRRGRVVTLPQPAETSARRWQRVGVVRTTLINQLMIAGFFAGLSPQRMGRFYRRWED